MYFNVSLSLLSILPVLFILSSINHKPMFVFLDLPPHTPAPLVLLLTLISIDWRVVTGHFRGMYHHPSFLPLHSSLF